MSARQLVGVLAHEFGHFAQQGGMRAAVLIHGVNRWLESRAYHPDAWDERRRGWLVCVRGTGEIAGVVNVSEIVRGSLRSAYLGYYVFAGFERRGIMRAGLKAVVRHSFRSDRLHRLEANIQPTNRASRALARSCGFVKEGYSRRYLKIGGRWRDHERWAIVAS